MKCSSGVTSTESPGLTSMRETIKGEKDKSSAKEYQTKTEGNE